MQRQVARLSWRAYTQIPQAEHWVASIQGLRPMFMGAFGFTDTCLIPGISAAGATPEARRYTALADAEALLHGHSPRLPTSPAGYPSPVVISRAILQGRGWPMRLFDCGLPEPLEGLISVYREGDPMPTARCLSTGKALSREAVIHLFSQGLVWGTREMSDAEYWVIGECVAGGTTTALAVLLALGWDAADRVNSSHPICNHAQKLKLVQHGLAHLPPTADGLAIAAAIGDPMQPFVAGLMLAASCSRPVLLAGGTQMLAVYALATRIAAEQKIRWNPERVVVGTTRWVAEDRSGDTIGLAERVGPLPLLATQLSFHSSRHPQLRAYEQGFVKEGVGAGGLCIAVGLEGIWDHNQLLTQIECLYDCWLVSKPLGSG